MVTYLKLTALVHMIGRFLLGLAALVRLALTMALMLLAVAVIGVVSRQIGVVRNMRYRMRANALR